MGSNLVLIDRVGMEIEWERFWNAPFQPRGGYVGLDGRMHVENEVDYYNLEILDEGDEQ